MPDRTPRLLVLCGSLRTQSLNRLAVNVAAKAAESAGATIDHTDAKDLDIPLYDQDLEDASGIPEKALALRDRMKAADGFLVACPEYNGTLSGAMKNAIDWATRPCDGDKPLECFKGKTAGLIAASPGKLGGIRGLPETRRILAGIGVHVLAGDFALSNAHEVFDTSGACTDDAARSGLEALGSTVAQITAAIINR